MYDVYWPTPGFKGRRFKLCVITRWGFNFCVRSSSLRGHRQINTSLWHFAVVFMHDNTFKGTSEARSPCAWHLEKETENGTSLRTQNRWHLPTMFVIANAHVCPLSDSYIRNHRETTAGHPKVAMSNVKAEMYIVLLIMLTRTGLQL